MEKMSFDASLARLEEIVSDLESGQLSLEESLTLFEEGVKLSLACQQELKSTDARISRLIMKLNGELELEPFED